jgi:hypothetical protein
MLAKKERKFNPWKLDKPNHKRGKKNNKGCQTKLVRVNIKAILKAFPCGYDCREAVNRRMKKSNTLSETIPLIQV